MDYITSYIDISFNSSLNTFYIVSLIFCLFCPIIICMAISRFFNSINVGGTYKLLFGKNGKKIKNVNTFKNIPCNKNIFRAYWIACNYDIVNRKTDFLGAVLLQWQKEGKIEIKKESIYLKKNNTFTNKYENKMYNYMLETSNNGVLLSSTFEKWCSENYNKLLKWFDDVIDYESDILFSEEKLTFLKEKTFKVDVSMKEEAIKISGLKKYFNEFKNIQDKNNIDVMFLRDYLIYAQIMGILKEVLKEIKRLYSDITFDDVIYINTFSYNAISSALKAKNGTIN